MALVHDHIGRPCPDSGDGDFFLACEDFWGECSTIHSTPELFFFFSED